MTIMSRPRMLDLFCGAGGCSVGYVPDALPYPGALVRVYPVEPT